jgi:outer membrane protein assembly factor BamE (lipoprotein component of BamABCDE complex)
MRLRTFIVVLALAFVLAACSKFSGSGAKWQGDVAAAQELSAGMSEAKVQALLGEPTAKQVMKVADQSLTAWYYVGEKDSVNVVFNTQGELTNVGVNGKSLIGSSED